MTELSIVVPSSRGFSRVRPLISSLAACWSQHPDFSRRCEILWVLNGPAHPHFDRFKLEASQPVWAGSLRVIREEAAHVNRARNRGATEAQGRVLMFLDDDEIWPDGTQLLDVLNEAEKHKTENWALGGRYRARTRGSVAGFYAWQQCHYQELRDRRGDPLLLGGFMILPRSTFFRVGGFDPDRAWGGAELGLNRRLRSAGVTVWLSPTWFVHHNVRMGWRDLIHKAVRQGEGSRGEPDSMLEAWPAAPRFSWRPWQRLYTAGFFVGAHGSTPWREELRRRPSTLLWLALGAPWSRHEFFQSKAWWKFLWKTSWHVLRWRNFFGSGRLESSGILDHQLAELDLEFKFAGVVMDNFRAGESLKPVKGADHDGTGSRQPRTPGYETSS